MIIDWNNSYDKSKSVDWNQAQLVNWYLVANKRGLLPLAAMPSPGTTLFSSNTGAVNRGGYKYNKVLYCVIDSSFYKINSDGTKTLLGTLNTSSGHLGNNKWASITDQILFVDGTNGYHYNVSTNTFTVISDVDFPNTAKSVTAQDEYFLVNHPNSPIVNYSDPSDGLNWNALSIVQKNRVASDVEGVLAVHGQVMFIGSNTIEPYFNSGAPFERSQDSLLYVGTKIIETACIASDASVYMLVSQYGGGPRVVQIKQDQFGSISNSINADLKNITSTSDAFAYIYEQEEQEFYVLTFPTDNVTFSYNITTQSWNKLESYVNSSYGRHISNWIVGCYDKVLIGDYQSGNIYTLDSNVFTENLIPIRRKLVTYPFYQEGKYITGHQLQVLFESGLDTGSTVDVSFSKDNGHTFTAFSPTRDIGTDFGSRALLYQRLGSARSWVFQVQTTMTTKAVMLGAVGNFTAGAW